ncbi:MAG: hypothetical protein GF329_12970 [Candidatus Lokiarchaeota archaeon]|nr:hypothetical protein [Candidatus Lokiarchaeota archaeon]
MAKKTVIKIRFALSDEPIFLEVEDKSKSIKSILHNAVDKLEVLGMSHEAIQLSNVLKDHNIYIQGSQVNPDAILETLPLENKTVNEDEIEYAEVQLLREHRGGL